VVVEVATDVPGRFAAGSELWLCAADGSRRRVRVASGAVRGGTARVRFEGAASRSDAEAMRGCELEVPVDLVPAAAEGSYWQHELIGVRCRDARAGDLGVVEGWIEQAGGLLLEVRGGRGVLLIPFVEPFLRGLDRAARVLDVDLPPGLVETCVSRS